jgi:hypothetical protein
MCGIDMCEPFPWLQVWWHLFHSRLILLQRTPRSFVVVRIVVVVVIRSSGRGASNLVSERFVYGSCIRGWLELFR